MSRTWCHADCFYPLAVALARDVGLTSGIAQWKSQVSEHYDTTAFVRLSNDGDKGKQKKPRHRLRISGWHNNPFVLVALGVIVVAPVAVVRIEFHGLQLLGSKHEAEPPLAEKSNSSRPAPNMASSAITITQDSDHESAGNATERPSIAHNAVNPSQNYVPQHVTLRSSLQPLIPQSGEAFFTS